jgi:hypothetical protein
VAFELADEYLLPALKEYSTVAFSKQVHKRWNTSTFAAAIEDVYTSCPDGNVLTEILIRVAKLHAAALFAKTPGTAEFHRVIRLLATHTFAPDLASGPPLSIRYLHNWKW